MANIETDAAGNPIAYDSAGRRIAYDSAGRPIAADVVHGRPVTVDGYAADGRPVVDPVVQRPIADRVVERPVVERTVVERRSGGAGWLIALIIIVALVVAAFAFKLISIDQLTGGSAPKVEVTGGELPKFKVDTAKIDVGTKKTEVETPTISVQKADDNAPKQ